MYPHFIFFWGGTCPLYPLGSTPLRPTNNVEVLKEQKTINILSRNTQLPSQITGKRLESTSWFGYEASSRASCRNSCLMLGILAHRPMSCLLMQSSSSTCPLLSASCRATTANFADSILVDDMKFETDMFMARRRFQTLVLFVWTGATEPQRATDSGDGNKAEKQTKNYKISQFTTKIFTF